MGVAVQYTHILSRNLVVRGDKLRQLSENLGRRRPKLLPGIEEDFSRLLETLSIEADVVAKCKEETQL